MSSSSRIKQLRANISAVERALASSAASGSSEVVSVTFSTAGNSQSISKSASAWTAQLRHWKTELAQLLSGRRFFLARIVPDFGEP